MKRVFIFVSLMFFAFFLMIENVSAGEPIRLSSVEWEPYIGPKMNNGGYVYELIAECYKKAGYDLKVDYLPWARAVKLAKDGEYDGYMPEYYSEDLKKDFYVSNAFPGGPLGFFKKKNTKINYKKLEDLKPYSIGVVRGYVNTVEFDAASFLKKDEATDDIMNVRKLGAGRVEMIVCDKNVGYHILNTELNELAGEIEFVEPALEMKNLYLCISKSAPDALKKIEAFNKALDEMSANGLIKKIMVKHNL